MKFGRTGYSFVMDMAGNIVIHPTLQGVNIFRQKVLPPSPFRQMLSKKEGKILYPWRNPGESRPREKLIIFHYIPEVDWIVASSGYLDEFYAPLKTVRRVIAFTVLGSLLLMLPLTFAISRSITHPLGELIRRLERGAGDDFSLAIFGIACGFQCRKSLQVRDNAVATQIFHIVQEAVHNAVRHGRPRRIDITMDAVGSRGQLAVHDDGRGMPAPAVTDGMGLRIMGFRAKMIDAALDIRSAPEAGTVVSMALGENVSVS